MSRLASKAVGYWALIGLILACESWQAYSMAFTFARLAMRRCLHQHSAKVTPLVR